MIYVIGGQTATGKTNFAIRLAQKVDGVLVNFDSRQIYKNTDIVTGKDLTSSNFTLVHRIENYDIGYHTVSLNESQSKPVSIWLYDVVSPRQPFSSYSFADCARWVVQRIQMLGKTPILVGGTGFYLRQFIFGTTRLSKSTPDSEARTELNTKSKEELQNIFLSCVPKSETLSPEELSYYTLNHSDWNNPRRLIRRIEMIRTGFTPILNTKINVSEYSYRLFTHQNTEQLKLKITERVKSRINSGAVVELENLLQKGYLMSDPGLQSIGYMQLNEYRLKKITIEELIKSWTTAEVQYAKRQETYFMKHFKTLSEAV